MTAVPTVGAAAARPPAVMVEDGWQWLAAPAAWHADKRALLVADVHLGKVATFRALGVPLPPQVAAGSTLGNLARLTALVAAYAPKTLVFLGDLLHAREALRADTLNEIDTWRRQHAHLRMVLVEGNHDARAGALPAELGIESVAEPWPFGDAWLAHHPQWVRGAHVLAGHLHPACRVYGRADASVRLPCFWTRVDAGDGARLTVLPAFGEFTGAALVNREPGDRVVAVAGDRLFEIRASN